MQRRWRPGACRPVHVDELGALHGQEVQLALGRDCLGDQCLPCASAAVDGLLRCPSIVRRAGGSDVGMCHAAGRPPATAAATSRVVGIGVLGTHRLVRTRGGSTVRRAHRRSHVLHPASCTVRAYRRAGGRGEGGRTRPGRAVQQHAGTLLEPRREQVRMFERQLDRLEDDALHLRTRPLALRVALVPLACSGRLNTLRAKNDRSRTSRCALSPAIAALAEASGNVGKRLATVVARPSPLRSFLRAALAAPARSHRATAAAAAAPVQRDRAAILGGGCHGRRSPKCSGG
jgi:hypothetical protein